MHYNSWVYELLGHTTDQRMDEIYTKLKGKFLVIRNNDEDTILTNKLYDDMIKRYNEILKLKYYYNLLFFIILLNASIVQYSTCLLLACNLLLISQYQHTLTISSK